jgi:hypothetical protein
VTRRDSNRENNPLGAINRAAERAIDKHERLLHHKTLELLLGSMVARSSVREVRRTLLWYARHLREFHT